MSKIKAGTTSTTAYQVEADTTGTLVLQTGATPTTAVTIDTSQNVGIGTSSPASKLDVNGAGSLITLHRASDGSATGKVGSRNGSAFSLYNDGGSTSEVIVDGNNINFNVGATERARIDSSGNVAIGAVDTSLGRLTVQRLASSPQATLTISDVGTPSNDIGIYMRSTVQNGISWSSGAYLAFYRGGPGSTESARFDSSGNLLVGTTSTAGGKIVSNTGASNAAITTRHSGANGAAAGLYSLYDNTSGTAYGAVFFYNGFTSQAGQITYSSTTVTYGTSSDYRLKENVQPMTGALEKVVALKPCTYTWKSTGETSQGFIAHELQAIVPECVTGEKDEVRIVDVKDEEGNVIGTEEKPVYQGIDTSFLVATLTAAIQELKAELDAAKADIATLKGA